MQWACSHAFPGFSQGQLPVCCVCLRDTNCCPMPCCGRCRALQASSFRLSSSGLRTTSCTGTRSEELVSARSGGGSVMCVLFVCMQLAESCCCWVVQHYGCTALERGWERTLMQSSLIVKLTQLSPLKSESNCLGDAAPCYAVLACQKRLTMVDICNIDYFSSHTTTQFLDLSLFVAVAAGASRAVTVCAPQRMQSNPQTYIRFKSMHQTIMSEADCPVESCWWERPDIARRVLACLLRNRDVLVSDLVCVEWERLMVRTAPPLLAHHTTWRRRRQTSCTTSSAVMAAGRAP